MHRRTLLAAASLPGLTGLTGLSGLTPTAHAAAAPLAALERGVGGRLGFFALDTATGRSLAHRADERFAMASTFKALLACAVAQRVAAGQARWEDRIALRPGDRVPYAPRL